MRGQTDRPVAPVGRMPPETLSSVPWGRYPPVRRPLPDSSINYEVSP